MISVKDIIVVRKSSQVEARAAVEASMRTRVVETPNTSLHSRAPKPSSTHWSRDTKPSHHPSHPTLPRPAPDDSSTSHMFKSFSSNKT